jgi:hypothetical protein
MRSIPTMTRGKTLSRAAKSQVVFFRVSPEEYSAMQKASEATGSQSLSSFARFAVLFWLESHTNPGNVQKNDIHHLKAKFMDFEVAFDQFMRTKLEGEE